MYIKVLSLYIILIQTYRNMNKYPTLIKCEFKGKINLLSNCKENGSLCE